MGAPRADFALDDALDAEIARAADRVRGAEHVVALTGAGLSVESGIPPFRGPGGLWTKYGEPPMDGYQRFLRDPKRAWEERLDPSAPWAKALGETLAAAKPNAGHRALAELERRGACAAVITQTVDDLHRQAGTRNLLEIHGNHALLRCSQCHARFTPEELPVDPESLPPHCPECGERIQRQTVQQIADQLMELPERTRYQIVAPVVSQKKPAMLIYEVSQYREAAPTPEQRAAAEVLRSESMLAAVRHGWYDFDVALAR